MQSLMHATGTLSMLADWLSRSFIAARTSFASTAVKEKLESSVGVTYSRQSSSLSLAGNLETTRSTLDLKAFANSNGGILPAGSSSYICHCHLTRMNVADAWAGQAVVAQTPATYCSEGSDKLVIRAWAAWWLVIVIDGFATAMEKSVHL